MPCKARARGFTLLEAVVALAILAAAGLTLFAAVSQSVQMLQRAEQARQLDAAMRNALSIIEHVNPMRTPIGEQPLGEFELRWSAEPVEPPRDNATGALHPGLYEVGLYRVRLQLRRAGQLEREVEVRRTGYRQVRQPAAL